VDIWSVGCIFAELMLRIPYLPGESDMDQLKTIFRALGTPTEEDWPVCCEPVNLRRLWTFFKGHTKLPDYVPVGQFPKTPLRDLFTAASAETLNLLSKCLIYEPRRRIGAKEVRCHVLPRLLMPSPFVNRLFIIHTSSHFHFLLIHPSFLSLPANPPHVRSKKLMET
jgi:serine/threonine protein kinase